MQSLRDKLLQAGVVSREQADQSAARAEAERRARKEKKAAPPPPAAPVESEKERERRLNREAANRQKEIRALCDAHGIDTTGEQTFFFRTRKRELRRMHLTPEQVAALEKGELAIVDRPNGNERPYALVPRNVAEQVLALEQKAIRFWAKAPGESYGFEEDDAAPAAAPPSTSSGA
ncbi:MAG: DUF2058 family protein [Deltaproteobacteria bacterium]|nr:DUF2058 family protein [Deltaproteobacteria bacterium]